MAILNQDLIFTGSKKPKITIEIPDEPGAQDKLTLGLKGMLTPEIAEQLGCGYVYSSGTVAQGTMKHMALDSALADVELKLWSTSGEVDTFYPESIGSFVLNKTGAAQIEITMTVHTLGGFDPLLDFFRKNPGNGFSFAIRSRQGLLFEGGTRVDLAEEPSPAPDDDNDRSHETRPRGGKRKKKEAATPTEAEKEAAGFFDKLREFTKVEPEQETFPN